MCLSIIYIRTIFPFVMCYINMSFSGFTIINCSSKNNFVTPTVSVPFIAYPSYVCSISISTGYFLYLSTLSNTRHSNCYKVFIKDCYIINCNRYHSIVSRLDVVLAYVTFVTSGDWLA